jgi:hypothetical protein
MATLILVFCVVLLAYEMVRQSKDPLAVLKKARSAVPPPIQGSDSASVKAITLFFADPSGRLLAPELARIPFSDSTIENCRKALEALIRGPRDILTPIMPPSTKVRGLYMLEDGELVVDLSLDLEVDLKKIKSASLEALFVYGVANTLAQPALSGNADGSRPAEIPVKRVRFLMEGSPPREAFPAHLDVSAPVEADPRWIAQAQQ